MDYGKLITSGMEYIHDNYNVKFITKDEFYVIGIEVFLDYKS